MFSETFTSAVIQTTAAFNSTINSQELGTQHFAPASLFLRISQSKKTKPHPPTQIKKARKKASSPFSLSNVHLFSQQPHSCLCLLSDLRLSKKVKINFCIIQGSTSLICFSQFKYEDISEMQCTRHDFQKWILNCQGYTASFFQVQPLHNLLYHHKKYMVVNFYLENVPSIKKFVM